MRLMSLLVAAVAIACAARVAAANVPTDPITPIGCAAASAVPNDTLPAEDTLGVEVTVTRRWGVVPFESEFDVIVFSGVDSILSVAWDFDSDSLADAVGAPVTHTFADPLDYAVTADITTLEHGTLRRSAAVSGHSALMTMTFDDGQMSVIQMALPLLSSREMAATAYIVPAWVGKAWYMSWEQIHILEDFGWDVESHSLTHVNLTQVDSVTLHYELSQSKAALQAQGFAAKHFAPPFGACNGTVISATRQYYESCRNWRGLNPRVEEVDPYQIRWQVTSATKTFSDYQTMMDSVITYGGWLVLNNHIVDTDCSGMSNCVTGEMLADIIDYAVENHMKIVNIEEALASAEMEARQLDLRVPPAAPHRGGCELSLGELPISSFPVTAVFAVPAGTDGQISLYDARGRLVSHLARVTGGTGKYLAVWDGRNSSGIPVAGGCYFCVLRAGTEVLHTRKMVVAR